MLLVVVVLAKDAEVGGRARMEGGREGMGVENGSVWARAAEAPEATPVGGVSADMVWGRRECRWCIWAFLFRRTGPDGYIPRT